MTFNVTVIQKMLFFIKASWRVGPALLPEAIRGKPLTDSGLPWHASWILNICGDTMGLPH
jgi:hypothetical protein